MLVLGGHPCNADRRAAPQFPHSMGSDPRHAGVGRGFALRGDRQILDHAVEDRFAGRLPINAIVMSDTAPTRMRVVQAGCTRKVSGYRNLPLAS